MNASGLADKFSKLAAFLANETDAHGFFPFGRGQMEVFRELADFGRFAEIGQREHGLSK